MRESYSVLMSVYAKEKPTYLRQSMESMVAQTACPTDFVVVCDGPLTPELDGVIRDMQRKYPRLFQIVQLVENQGLGRALAAGLTQCKCPLVARMDSDDIALPQRCEWELEAMEQDPGLDLVGGQIEEFFPNRPPGQGWVKRVPQNMEDILRYGRRRNPFNHMTVMFRKNAVLMAGGYQDCPLFEDYDLWVRMWKQGSKMCNLPQVLVRARLPESGYSRRGGLSYFKAALRFLRRARRAGYLSRWDLLVDGAVRLPVAVAPGGMRNWMYRSLLRGSKSQDRGDVSET